MVDDNVGNTSDRPEAGRLPLSLALLPLRDTVLFPQSILPLAAGRAASLKLIEEAARGDRTIGVITQRDPAAEEPGEADLHRIGTVATIHKVVKQPDGTLRLVVQGLRRFRILELTQTRPYLLARVEEMDEVAAAGDLETEALVRNATTLFRQIVELSPLLPDELAGAVQNVTEPGRLADVIGASLPALSTAVKQELLETADVKARLQRLVATLTKEIEVLELGSKIQSQVESEMGKGQREYYLREQLKAIQKELGQTDDRTRELDELREKIEAAQMTEEAKKEALRELDRLGKMPPAAAEYTVARTYLDWLIALPWSKETTDLLDLGAARDHPRRGPLGARKGQGPDPRVPRREVDAPRRQGPDPVLRRAARRRQDLARPLHRARARPHVPPHLARRHARRGGDPRPPAHVYRRAPRSGHPGAAAGGVEEPRVHARRDRQARHGLSR